MNVSEQLPRLYLRRLGFGLLTSVLVAGAAGLTLAGLGVWFGTGPGAGPGFAGVALLVGTPLALVHALLVAPLAARLGREWAFAAHLGGGALLAGLLSLPLAPLGMIGGAVFFALERLLRPRRGHLP